MEQTELYQFANRQEYIEALDSVMPEKYHRTRKLGNNRSTTYLPIPIQEAVADMMWHEWNVVDESYQVFINEIVCTVKIAYTPSYPGANEQFCTGSASKPIQMRSQSKVEDFPNAKQQNALEYNIPSAKKTAIGNALEGVGNIFGRNIGREIDGQKLPTNFALRKPQKSTKNEETKSEQD
jgi:hypothetical protein